MKLFLNNDKSKLQSRIRRILTFVFIFAFSFGLKSCDEDGNLILKIPLTEQEVADGLKEALKVGTTNSVVTTNKLDGYYGNPLIRIPWPEEAAGAATYINNYLPVLKPLLTEVVLLMNRGAEQAADKAKPIFWNAITAMTIMDAWNILKGADNAATKYLYNNTFTSLHSAFKPDINSALQTVGAATAWTTITTQYNIVANLPINTSLKPINTDLADYTTLKALDGLFLLVEAEELKIRKDPVARINDILKRVFSELDN